MIERFQRAADAETVSNPAVGALKAAGRPVFGYTCSNFPEEVLYAAGIVPVQAVGSWRVPGQSDRLRPAGQCHIARSNLELALGEGFSNLDGFVVTNACDMAQNFHAALEDAGRFRFLHFISRPNLAHSKPALTFFRFELEVFKKAVEEYTGKRIEEADLSRAISVYNENRRLLRELYDLRGRTERPLVSAADASTVVLASLHMDKEEHNKLLAAYLAELRQGPPLAGSYTRVHLSGATYPGAELFELIEQAGGLVVSDDICLGTRYFLGLVDEDRDPLDALADRYLNKLACPCMHHGSKLDERYAFLKDELRETRGQGVIFALHRFCDTHLVDYQALRYRLLQDEIPCLYHEIDSSLGAGQLRTKLEAFFEILGRE